MRDAFISDPGSEPRSPYALRRNDLVQSRESGFDPLSDEQNPTYASVAQMFAAASQAADAATPRSEAPAAAAKPSMLLRFGAITGVAAAALAMFIGYVATTPQSGMDDRALTPTGRSVAAVEAGLVPSLVTEPAPAPETAPVQEAAAPEEAQPPAAALASEAAAAPATADAPPVQMAAAVPELPPPPPQRSQPKLGADELAMLMGRGRRFIDNGDFASARPVFRRAAEAGYAEAAVALGETFDPSTMEERGAFGLAPDIAEARRWYQKAQELGSLEAPTRLERLPAN